MPQTLKVRLGLLPVGLAAWLLDVHCSRVKQLIIEDVLKVEYLAGQRLVTFSSLHRYALRVERRWQRVSTPVPSSANSSDSVRLNQCFADAG